ncbi:glycosyltransferase family 2 protein [Paenibacillus hamazuiensis]|uniref:glycosyltransferase family 2 protein n=1 Tax=Paenibacillus hamazuiensis TaxID=2936508 RepID=UPI00200E9DEB|nr:glycosyltransferase family 2 protein [Paenibacillus hamazuiensis]
MGKPLLSIIIPTYNRANLLEKMLTSLLPQIGNYKDEIELIVSDNCSTDHTKDVIESALKKESFIYNKNNFNIGPVGNIFKTIQDIASGEFCWVLGDDDMVLNGKLHELIETIKKNNNFDYFFINYFVKSIEERNDIIDNNNSIYHPSFEECMLQDFVNKQLSSWEELFGIQTFMPSYLFTAIVSSLFRRSTWIKYSKAICLDNNAEMFSTLDTAYPHLKVIALSMHNKSVYYIGDPIVLLGQGSQEWFHLLPKLLLYRLRDAIILYEQIGVSEKYLNIVRQHYYIQYGTICAKLLEKNDDCSLELFNKAFDFEYLNGEIVNSFLKEMQLLLHKNKNNQKYLIDLLIRTLLNENDQDNLSIAIWGAGELGQFLYESSVELAKRVEVIVDSSPKVQGTIFKNKHKIQSPTYLINNQVDVVIIASIKYVDEIMSLINQLDIKSKVISVGNI